MTLLWQKNVLLHITIVATIILLFTKQSVNIKVEEGAVEQQLQQQQLENDKIVIGDINEQQQWTETDANSNEQEKSTDNLAKLLLQKQTIYFEELEQQQQLPNSKHQHQKQQEKQQHLQHYHRKQTTATTKQKHQRRNHHHQHHHHPVFSEEENVGVAYMGTKRDILKEHHQQQQQQQQQRRQYRQRQHTPTTHPHHKYDLAEHIQEQHQHHQYKHKHPLNYPEQPEPQQQHKQQKQQQHQVHQRHNNKQSASASSHHQQLHKLYRKTERLLPDVYYQNDDNNDVDIVVANEEANDDYTLNLKQLEMARNSMPMNLMDINEDIDDDDDDETEDENEKQINYNFNKNFQRKHEQQHKHQSEPLSLIAATTTAPTFSTTYNSYDIPSLELVGSDSSAFGTNSDFFPIPRSGRHRGRHITPTYTLLPYSSLVPAVNSNNIISNKVFRSLPDSDDQYEQHWQRMLATQSQRHWPVKREAIVEGDLILGGLMMVHSREDSITCGPIMPQGGIQALEAMLYTIDRINEARLLPNITLGAHILDDCDKDSYGLEMAVDFIKGSISNIDDAEYHCNKTQVRKVISGVVGAASSVTSIQVANLLRLFRIPQVSFFSTSPELSNKQRFEYFSRTIPSDHYQVKAMVEIVKRMGWSYVSIIYEESNYGIKAFEELEELLARHNICIAIKEKLVKDSGVAEEIAYDNIVLKLLTKPRARGAIIFGSDQEVREVMRAVRRNNATGAFSWIGSDGWSARRLVSDGNEPEVEGTLSVQPQANPVKGFEEYFLNLTVENNQRNPWFAEFWEDHFECRYPGSFSTPYNSYNRTCTTKEKLSKDTDFEDQLQFVSDAVMAFAYALRDMHRDLCGGRPSLCDAMKPTKGADLLKYLRKVQFQGLSGDHFRFDGNGDGPARYNIIHFKQTDDGQYHWVKVGEYYEGELRLNMTEVQFKLLHPKPPESVCSLPCERGQAKKYVEGESCCWHCFNCSTYQIRHPTDETQCLTCQLGTLPDASKQFCQTIPEVYLRPESAWAIGAMAFSAMGTFVTLFVVGVFVRHNDTPIVRASGRELSYILLAGILMCYAVTFALVLRPTNIVCAIQRFSVGFCFTVVYAALLTKTNRIARIFKAGMQSAKRPSFISPKSQLVICSFLIFIQILINGVWMVIAPSHAMYHHPTREDNMLVCDSYIDASYMIAFFYPIVLIVVCTVYAILTRKIPEAFNESKHIGFTMYTTCVIWLAFVPLYFGTANHVPLRITSMSVTISLSASVTIACLFSPKLYIILIRPERNVRQSMMPPRYGNMHRTAGTGPSSMMAAAVVTAATCAQEEKIQKHITPTNTEHSNKSKKLCEMATQTITISSIFTNLDSTTYNQIPFADQYVPNNHQQQQHDPHEQHTHAEQHHDIEKVVANNNKINQQQHGNPNVTIVEPTTTTANSSGNSIGTCETPAAAVAPLTNHIMLQQHNAPFNAATANKNIDCNKTQTTTTTL